MRSAFFGALAILMFTLGGGAIPVQTKTSAAPAPAVEPQRPFNIWMDVKLKESQEIFRALAKADFVTIQESVDELQLLNTIEGWVRTRNPEYTTQLRAFEFAIAEVRRQAVRENVEGVTLAFHQLTLSCVNCHKQLRDARNSPAASAAAVEQESSK